jgi:hypothetical protein
MSLDICLVSARWRCIINEKYSVVITVSDYVDEPRYDTVEFWSFYENREEIDEIPGLDKEEVKERIIELIKSIEKPLIKEKR